MYMLPNPNGWSCIAAIVELPSHAMNTTSNKLIIINIMVGIDDVVTSTTWVSLSVYSTSNEIIGAMNIKPIATILDNITIADFFTIIFLSFLSIQDYHHIHQAIIDFLIIFLIIAPL